MLSFSPKTLFLFGFLTCFIALLIGVISLKQKQPEVLGAIYQTSGMACKGISLYKNPSWQPVTALELATLVENTPLFLVASPSQPGTLYNRARFRLRQNSIFTQWQETETKTAQGEYYLAYTIPFGTTDISIEAELHNTGGEWK